MPPRFRPPRGALIAGAVSTDDIQHKVVVMGSRVAKAWWLLAGFDAHGWTFVARLQGRTSKAGAWPVFRNRTSLAGRLAVARQRKVGSLHWRREWVLLVSPGERVAGAGWLICRRR